MENRLFSEWQNGIVKNKEMFNLSEIEKLFDDKDKKLDFQIKKYTVLLGLGNWFMKMGNLNKAEEYFNLVHEKIEDFHLSDGQLKVKDEQTKKKIGMWVAMYKAPDSLDDKKCLDFELV